VRVPDLFVKGQRGHGSMFEGLLLAGVKMLAWTRGQARRYAKTPRKWPRNVSEKVRSAKTGVPKTYSATAAGTQKAPRSCRFEILLCFVFYNLGKSLISGAAVGRWFRGKRTFARLRLGTAPGNMFPGSPSTSLLGISRPHSLTSCNRLAQQRRNCKKRLSRPQRMGNQGAALWRGSWS
jgi:hypothetical protein